MDINSDNNHRTIIAVFCSLSHAAALFLPALTHLMRGGSRLTKIKTILLRIVGCWRLQRHLRTGQTSLYRSFVVHRSIQHERRFSPILSAGGFTIAREQVQVAVKHRAVEARGESRFSRSRQHR